MQLDLGGHPAQAGSKRPAIVGYHSLCRESSWPEGGTLSDSPPLVGAGEPNVSPFGPSTATHYSPAPAPSRPPRNLRRAGDFTFRAAILLPHLHGRPLGLVALPSPRPDSLAIRFDVLSLSLASAFAALVERSFVRCFSCRFVNEFPTRLAWAHLPDSPRPILSPA